MNTITVSADQAAGLVFELFKAKPWINQGGVMQPEDECAEGDAVRFLLSIETADGWGAAGDSVKRVVNSLLLDFLAKLMHPASPFSGRQWRVPADGPAWRQAAVILADEIRHSHGHLATRH
ncbi:MAG: hypothetical protein A3H93_09050 [Rhodocyclales bacterium RIFCSPLOWO2_02_FULL_63_24]|nr:MAG: hypothetical protein A3H93_09050 [Rhodocyclales bacterium RIFCSPLOWO2_02_FULL_63_24]